MFQPTESREAKPARLRRLIPEPGEGVSNRGVSLSILAVSVWAGLCTGLLELALELGIKRFSGDFPIFFRGNRHVLWMVPVVNLVVFGAVGALLALLARRRPALAERLASFLLGFLSILTLSLTIRGLYPIACAILALGVGYRLAPRLRANRGAVRWVVRRSLPILAVLVGGLVAASHGREAWAERRTEATLAAARRDAPNVILIVLDTVRADHLSAYGYVRATTPSLARLAARGVRFERARSTAPWTLPSHASMFTGRWPHETSASVLGPLDDRHATLAEALRAEGYSTAGFVANTLYCGREAGLGRGFAHYEDHRLSPRGILAATALGGRVLDKTITSAQKLADAVGLGAWLGPGNGKPYKDAARISGDFLSWLDDRPEPDRPFFAFLNYYDAHDPYVLPTGYDRHLGLRPETHADRLVLNRWWGIDKRKLTPRQVALARDAYDDCIAYLDDQVGRMLDELRRRGILDQTVVIVTADHGEHLGEHSLYGHAGSLYEAEVHVPLVISAPALGLPSGAQVPEPVSLRELAATVVDLAGTRAVVPFPGASLKRYWDEPAKVGAKAAGPVLSEVDNPLKIPHANGGRSPAFRGSIKALADGEWSYVRNGDGREELYDLTRDPGELHDLAGSAETTLQRFRSELDRLLNASGARPEDARAGRRGGE